MTLPTTRETPATATACGDAAAMTRRLLALAEVLDEEAALAESLAESLARMRAAVAGSDPAPLEHEAEGMGGVLHAMQEARRRRGEVLAALVGEEAFPLDAVAAALELAAPPSLEAARRRLRAAGRTVVREATINRAVLRRALAQGDRYLQALFAAAGAPAYGPAERAAGRAGGAGILVNRRV